MNPHRLRGAIGVAVLVAAAAASSWRGRVAPMGGTAPVASALGAAGRPVSVVRGSDAATALPSVVPSFVEALAACRQWEQASRAHAERCGRFIPPDPTYLGAWPELCAHERAAAGTLLGLADLREGATALAVAGCDDEEVTLASVESSRGTLAEGAPCQWNGQCATGYCDADGPADATRCGRCAARRPLGAPCAQDEECAGHACREGVCDEARGGLGAACATADDCEDALCVEGVCRGREGDPCRVAFECETNACAEGVCAPRKTGKEGRDAGPLIERARHALLEEANPHAAKDLLVPEVFGGRASVEAIGLLVSVCREVNDTVCVVMAKRQLSRTTAAALLDGDAESDASAPSGGPEGRAPGDPALGPGARPLEPAALESRRPIGRPCEADDECARGLRCDARSHRCRAPRVAAPGELCGVPDGAEACPFDFDCSQASPEGRCPRPAGMGARCGADAATDGVPLICPWGAHCDNGTCRFMLDVACARSGAP